MTTLIFDATDELVRFYVKNGDTYKVLHNGDIEVSNGTVFTGIDKSNILIKENVDVKPGQRGQYLFNGGTIIENPDFIKQPKEVSEQEYKTLEIDLLGAISDPGIVEPLLQYQDEFDKWVSKRPTLQALLNKGTVTFDNFKLAILRQIIETDKNSTFNPLGTGLANVLNGLLDQLEAKLNA